MLVKSVLVAMLILVSWNSHKLMQSNSYLRDQFTNVKKQMEDYQVQFQKNTDSLKQIVKRGGNKADIAPVKDSVIKIESIVKKQIQRNDDFLKMLEQLSANDDSLAKQIVNNEEIFHNNAKKSDENTAEIKTTLIKQSKLFDQHQGAIGAIAPMKKSLDEISEMVKAQSHILAKNSSSLASLSLSYDRSRPQVKKTLNPAPIPTPTQKPSTLPKKHLTQVNLKPKRQLLPDYNKYTQLDNKEEFEDAIIQLARLKAEQWKYQDSENATKKSFISALSAIEDIMKKEDRDLDLDNEYKKAIIPVRNSINEISLLLKKQSKILAKNTHKNNTTNSIQLANLNINPNIENTATKSDANPLFLNLNSAKEFHQKLDNSKASAELDKLKDEVWKCRHNDNVSNDLILSTFSSIDIVKNNWKDNNTDYDLNEVEKKIVQLSSQSGECE